MTQEDIKFIELCEKETAEIFDRFINDEEFMTSRVKDMVKVMKEASRTAIEFEKSGASKEEIQKAQAEYLASITENQLVSMKGISSETVLCLKTFFNIPIYWEISKNRFSSSSKLSGSLYRLISSGFSFSKPLFLNSSSVERINCFSSFERLSIFGR